MAMLAFQNMQCSHSFKLLTEGLLLFQKCLIVILLGQQEVSTRIPMKVSSHSAFSLRNIKNESVLYLDLENGTIYKS